MQSKRRLKRALSILLLSSLLVTSAHSQKRLAGLFEGALTIGGLQGSGTQRLEMYLKIEGKTITGRSYLHLGSNKTIEMALQGRFYDDFSIYIEEIGEIPATDSTLHAPYPRKYQLMYSGNFEDVVLSGFWQQVNDAPLDKQRQLGRIRLQKVRTNKA